MIKAIGDFFRYLWWQSGGEEWFGFWLFLILVIVGVSIYFWRNRKR